MRLYPGSCPPTLGRRFNFSQLTHPGLLIVPRRANASPKYANGNACLGSDWLGRPLQGLETLQVSLGPHPGSSRQGLGSLRGRMFAHFDVRNLQMVPGLDFHFPPAYLDTNALSLHSIGSQHFSTAIRDDYILLEPALAAAGNPHSRALVPAPIHGGKSGHATGPQ